MIKAVFRLSQRKIGALIAIERAASLEPYMEGAHRVHAEISHELLLSIFHPTSPIHDGAVILTAQQIEVAGAFFPISLAKASLKAYGTRHRAAIQLTEITDAICLVVSEERGTVGLVQDGTLTPVVDANHLRARLQEGLERSPVEESKVVAGSVEHA